jgi:hypothetical protein
LHPTNRQFVREMVIADKVMIAAELGFRVTTGASLIVFASRKVDSTLLGAFRPAENDFCHRLRLGKADSRTPVCPITRQAAFGKIQ